MNNVMDYMSQFTGKQSNAPVTPPSESKTAPTQSLTDLIECVGELYSSPRQASATTPSVVFTVEQLQEQFRSFLRNLQATADQIDKTQGREKGDQLWESMCVHVDGAWDKYTTKQLIV